MSCSGNKNQTVDYQVRAEARTAEVKYSRIRPLWTKGMNRLSLLMWYKISRALSE